MATTEELHALVQQQADEIRMLRDELAAVRRRLDEVGVGPAPVELPVTPRTPAGPGAVEVGDEVTDRRQLLRRAGVAAAGAAAGGAAVVLTTASPAAAAQGIFDGSPAVQASGTGPGSAVVATSSTSVATVDARNGSGHGVYAESRGTTGAGVWASGAGGSGVLATVDTGYPVIASANTTSAKANLLLRGPFAEPPTPSGLPVPTTRTDGHELGELTLDVNRDLWLCTAAGAPGTWRRLGGNATAGALTLLNTPVRVYDSRPNNLPNIGSKTPIANGAIRIVDCKGNSSGVPAGATGVLANFTVVNTSASGFLAAYKAGAALPGASTINWFTTGEIVANTTVVACDATAQIACYVGPGSSTDVIIDVVGYYR